MGVYRLQYRDKKTGEQKHTKTWYYEFLFRGRLIKESAKTTSKTVAKEAERERRRELEKGFNGLSDSRDDRIRTVRELANRFLQEYQIRQPKSATFAEYALNHVTRFLGALMIVDITDKIVVGYQTSRLKEGAAPKLINEEVGFLLRLLPIAQAGAIRAQLRQEKKLKLKSTKRIGRAYSSEEKAELLKATQENRRSKAIHLVTMLALHAGLRDKEIRMLQWSRLDLEKQMVTVGQSKSSAGTGRTIPMNHGLSLAVTEYATWYKERFKAVEPDWYVFPFGKPRPSDPTRPQTTFKTAWRKTREKAGVQGRFHDNRHTFMTDLAESGAGDQVIQDLAGHVSKDMVKHYSHIRTEAKRRAVEALTAGHKEKTRKQPSQPGFESVPQVSPQVSVLENKLSGF